MKNHNIQNPSSAPLASLFLLFVCVVIAGALYYFNGPIFIALGGLPLVFYMAGRESEWVKQRNNDISQFKQDIAQSIDESSETENKINRFRKEIKRIRKEEGFDYSTMNTPTV